MQRPLIVALMAVAAVMPLDAQAARWTQQDLLSISPIGDAPLAPDGKTIALVRSGQIVTMPSMGGDFTVISHAAGGKSGLSWSPDGQTIAYVNDGNICTVPAMGGSSTCLTSSGTPDSHLWGDHDPQWSPDGKRILFERGGIEKSGALMLVSRAGGNASYLVKSEENDIRPSWAPDGRSVSYTEITEQHFSGQLKVVAFDPDRGQPMGQPKTLYTVPTDRGGWWQLRKADWSPDSKSLAIVLQTDGWDHVYLMKRDGGRPKELTSGKFEDADPVFSPDGKSIAIISNRTEPERRDIWIAPVNGGAAHALSSNDVPGVESAPQWSPDGKQVYFLRQTSTDSNNLYVADVSAPGGAKKLTNSLPKALEGVLVDPKRVTYRSKDGQEVSAFIYVPRDLQPGRHYPAIMWIHGGPEEQNTYDLGFWQLWGQYLAQAGYVVMMPNFRGSIGYGEKFRNLNVEDSGGGEVEDVVAGAQYLVSSGLADPQQIAIGGQSHGGTMVGYAVTEYPTLFKAAIVVAGVWDRATYLQGTYPHSVTRWRIKMGGTPEQKPAVYLKANSLKRADRIQAPLLFFHGQIDPVVPPEESAQITAALKRDGKVFYYFTYPGEYHGLTKRPNRLDMFRKQLAFLKQYVNPSFNFDPVSPDMLNAPPPPADGPNGY